jgi:hypothetical protein
MSAAAGFWLLLKNLPLIWSILTKLYEAGEEAHFKFEIRKDKEKINLVFTDKEKPHAQRASDLNDVFRK